MTDADVKDAQISADEIKALVRHRDGYCCTVCGMSVAEHRKRYDMTLDVHRVVPGSKYTLSGCRTLCRKCHGPQVRCPSNMNPATTRFVQMDKEVIRWSHVARHLHNHPTTLTEFLSEIIRAAVVAELPKRGVTLPS